MNMELDEVNTIIAALELLNTPSARALLTRLDCEMRCAAMQEYRCSHAWEEIDPSLWKCQFCDGFFALDVMPNSDAVALTEAVAKMQILIKLGWRISTGPHQIF